MDSDDFAMARGHVLDINANAFRSKAQLIKEYNKLADKGWFVKETDYHAIINHEIGHMVADRYKIDGLSIAMKITGLGRKETMKYMEKNLSEYSSKFKDGSEIILEVFTYVYNSKKPGEFSLKFMKECIKLIKEGGT